MTGNYLDVTCYSLLGGGDSDEERAVCGVWTGRIKALTREVTYCRCLTRNGRIGYSRGWRGGGLLFEYIDEDE